MVGIRVEGSSKEEVVIVGVQIGVQITRIYKRRGGGFYGYGKVILDESRRIQITDQQIAVISLLIKDRIDLERFKKNYEDSITIDGEFTVE